MKKVLTHVWRSIFIAAVVSVVSCSSGSQKETDLKSSAPGPTIGSNSSTVPVDVSNPTNPSQNDWFNLAWQTFIAINWPAVAPTPSTNLGQPDTTKTIGAQASNGAMIPTVWVTYRGLNTTMLAQGKDPGAWNSGMPQPPAGCAAAPPNSVAPGFQPIILDMYSKFSKAPLNQDDINEAFAGPLVDQMGWYVIYDIRLDQSEYTYIQQNGYFDAATQIKIYQGGGTIQPFPRTGQESYFKTPLPSYAQYGALEIKAAWRVLNPQKDIFSRYYTQTGYFIQPDGTTCQGPVTFGLVGLHILRLTPTTPGTWFWATFEQVDNTTVPAGITRPDGTPLTPSFAAPNTPNGSCTSSYNVKPSPISGNIPWSSTNTPVNVCQVVSPLPGDVLSSNKFWQGQLQGTVWSFYQLDYTINPTVKGASGFTFPPIKDPNNTVNTNTLFNTTMETYFQAQGANCMNCHGSAAPQGAPTPLTATNQIFTFLLRNADSSDPSLKRQRVPRLFDQFAQAKSR